MQKNYGVKCLGLGASLPSKTVTNDDLKNLFDTSDEWITKRTGIKERKVISNDESGLSLSHDASIMALKQANLSPLDIDLILVATSTPDNFYPSMACMLQGKLGASNAVCFDISAACSGFIYGMITAAQFIYNGTYKNILLVGVDIHSRFMDWSDRSVSILFGDGAGALVMSSCLAKDDEMIKYIMGSSSDVNFDLILKNSNVTYPDIDPLIKPDVVKMNGKAIFEFGIKIIPDTIHKLIDTCGLTLADIDYFLPHQANQRIIEAAAKKLGFKEHQIISNISKVGNTSAASIPLALYDAMANKAIKGPARIVLIGFGAGLTWGAVLLNWNLK